MTNTRPGGYEGRKGMKMTLMEKIKKLQPNTIVSLRNRYGVFWIGKAKYVFGAVTAEAWHSTDIEVEI